MDLLDRYIYQVRRYLPLLEREKSLDKLILTIKNDADINNEEDLALYLINLGHPRDTARKIRGNKGLFSAELSPLIDLIIKFVSALLPLLLLLIRLLEFISTHEGYNLLDLLLYIVYYIPTIVIFLFAAIGFIFMAFVLIERYIQPRFNLDTLKFDPTKLPLAPTKEFKTPFLLNFLGLMICIGLLYLINLEQGLIALYHNQSTILLLNERFNQILILIDISLLLNVGLFIFHIFKRRKTTISKMIEIISNYFFSIILILFSFTKVFNQTFIETFNLKFLPITVQIVFTLLAISIMSKATLNLFKFLKRKKSNRCETNPIK